MKRQPHILFLFTDQQRRDTIHALGNERICTPALDELAARSAVFDRCFTPAPVCVPARFSMFAGQYPGRTGCCNNNGRYAYDGEGFYARLTAAGYQSCCVGKMHHSKDPYGPMGFGRRWTQEELSRPEDDYTRFIMASPYKDVFDYNGMRSEMYYVPQISQLPAEVHPTQWVGDRSVEFIRSCQPDRPLFLMSSFIHPHPPFAPPAPWNKMYRTVSDEPYMPARPEQFAAFLSDRFTREKLGISRQDLTLLRNYYYACVSFVDYQIGRIIRALKERGMYDDTVILFASDHGEMLGDFGTMGKRSMLDASVHIPLMIRVPGMAPGRRDRLCSLVDIASTLLRLAGVGYDPEQFDGLDLLGDERHQVVFSQYSTGASGSYMVTDGRKKLVYHAFEDRYYCFDRAPEDADKYDPADPDAARLREHLERYMAADVCDAGAGATDDDVSGASKLPYGPKRADHLMRRAEELARMPEGYPIDI